MKGNRFEGEVTNVECTENGFCQIRITSPYSGDVYEVEIGQKALELINYNLEEVKKTTLIMSCLRHQLISTFMRMTQANVKSFLPPLCFMAYALFVIA